MWQERLSFKTSSRCLGWAGRGVCSPRTVLESSACTVCWRDAEAGCGGGLFPSGLGRFRTRVISRQRWGLVAGSNGQPFPAFLLNVVSPSHQRCFDFERLQLPWWREGQLLRGSRMLFADPEAGCEGVGIGWPCPHDPLGTLVIQVSFHRLPWSVPSCSHLRGKSLCRMGSWNWARTGSLATSRS